MNVLIPGGAGYVGTVLAPYLAAHGHRVTVYDSMLFGNMLPPGIEVIEADVRDAPAFRRACKDQHAVIYLASISSDAMCQKHAAMAHEVNVASFEPNVYAAKEARVRSFVYASSVAAYGSAEDATEETPLRPTTAYGKGKAACEEVLKRFDRWTIVRSASVCGYSPRMRFDLTVNKMVHDAIRHGVITVNGGDQKRCHIHIADLCDFYRRVISMSWPSAEQVFNVVGENQSVMQTAETVIREISPGVRRARNMRAFITVGESTDDRSYTVDGAKATESALRFRPKKCVAQAVIDIAAKFEAAAFDDLDDPVYQNVVNG